MPVPKCEDCGRSVTDPGVILVRTSPKGEKAIWKCEPCAGKLADRIIQEIDKVLDHE